MAAVFTLLNNSCACKGHVLCFGNNYVELIQSMCIIYHKIHCGSELVLHELV